MSNTKRNRVLSRYGCILGILSILIILCAGITLSRIPNIPEQLANKPQVLVVTVTQPADGSQWQLFSTITISAEAAGSRPVESLELWVDGHLLHKVIAPSGRAAWTWTMEGVSQHTLVVRAVDDQGLVYNSNVVRVIGVINQHAGFDMLYTAKNGDTIASVAASFGIDTKELSDANAPLDANGPLPDGTKLKVPISIPPITAPPGGQGNPPPPNPSGPVQPPSPNKVNKFVFWVSQFLQPTAPAAPALALGASSCSLNVIIADHSQNELGFNIYRLDPNAQGFKKIATLGENGNASIPIQYVDPDLYGAFSYYVSAFNAGGESPSNIVTGNITEADCQTPFWAGSQAGAPPPGSPITDQTQFPAPAKYDKAYYYLSIDNGPRQRVPADPNQFLPLNAGRFDVGEQMKALTLAKGSAPLKVDFDAWGWNGGTLVHIGDFKDVILTQPNSPIFSLPGLVQVCSNPPCFQGADVGGSYINDATGTEFNSWQFRWLANSTDITAGLVQVSIIPFDKTCGANPIGLVWSSTIPASAQYSTLFNVDLAALHTKPVKVGGWTISDNVGFYVRVIPQINGQTFCQPSNTATWQYKAFVPPTPKPAPKMSDPYSIFIAGVQPYGFADPSKAGCVQVVKNDYYHALPPGVDYQAWLNQVKNNPSVVLQYAPGVGNDPNVLIQLGYWIPAAPGDGLCPPPPPPPPDDGNIIDQYESLAKATVNGLEKGLDEAANGYNAAKTWLVENVASEIPICNQSAGCQQALGAALDAGLAAVGLPPNLPATQDLMKAAEGDIADEVVAQMGNYCPDKTACKAAVQQGLDAMIAKNEQDQSNSLCQSGYCIPPQYANGIITAPWPTASAMPAIASVQVVRLTPPDSELPPFSCGFDLYSSATNDSWNGQTGIPLGDYNQLFWTGEHIEGSLFQPVTVSIPSGMAPGDSVTIPVVLLPRSDPYPGCWSCGFWMLQHEHWDLDNLPDGQPDSDDWSLLYRGSNATFTPYMTCSSPSTGTAFANLKNVIKSKLDVTFPK